MCAVGGIKDPKILGGCAAVGGIGLMGTAAFSAEPTFEAAIREGVKHLSSGAAEHFGDTATEKAAIRQLVGDTANLAGVLAGGKYLQHRMSNIGSFGDLATGMSETAKKIFGRETSAAERKSAANPLKSNEIPGKFTSDIFSSDHVTWTLPTGTQQTYQVFQRTDINWSHVRTGGKREFVGKTNMEAAKTGLAPQLSDGSMATLHHINQNGLGKLVEASTRYHGIGKSGQDTLHRLYGRLKPHPANPVDRVKFKQDTNAYWRARVKE